MRIGWPNVDGSPDDSVAGRRDKMALDARSAEGMVVIRIVIRFTGREEVRGQFTIRG
jgi:hypothetical protein